MKHPSTPHRPHPDPEILALAESDAPDCGKEFNPGLCRTRHLAAKAREARGLEHGLCAYCPLILKHLGIVTKSADNDTPTCATCGNTLTKNGFCHSCRSTAQQAREAEKRQMCKTCGKVRVKDGFEYCSYCLKHAGRLKFKLKLEEPKPMTTTEDKPIEKQPAKKRPATCKQCGKPCTFNESGLCRPCSAARNARKAREAKPLSEPAKSTPEPKIEQKPELQRCPKCGKKLTKNGFCYTCAAHEREAKKSKKTAPKTGAMKTLPNLPASRLCQEFQIQNCHDCDDLTCGDNLRKPAADTIHAAKLPGPEEYALANPPKRARLLSLHRTLTEQARELMTRKNADYGANADPFANFRMSALLHIEPEFGVLLRMQDKMARLVSFLEKGELAVKEESWSDAIIDIINYSVLLCGLLRERVET
jgi:hypothetical protein